MLKGSFISRYEGGMEKVLNGLDVDIKAIGNRRIRF
jgi:hypothetical protein